MAIDTFCTVYFPAVSLLPKTILLMTRLSSVRPLEGRPGDKGKSGEKIVKTETMKLLLKSWQLYYCRQIK